MPKFAIIENKEVINVIVANQDFIDANYPDAIECDETIGIGWSYDKKKFIAPPPNIIFPDETISQ